MTCTKVAFMLQRCVLQCCVSFQGLTLRSLWRSSCGKSSGTWRRSGMHALDFEARPLSVSVRDMVYLVLPNVHPKQAAKKRLLSPRPAGDLHEHLNSGKSVFDKMTMKSKRLFIKWTQDLGNAEAPTDAQAGPCTCCIHAWSARAPLCS